MFPCRNDFCNKYVKGVISDLYEITKFEIQTTKKKFCTIYQHLLINRSRIKDNFVHLNVLLI